MMLNGGYRQSRYRNPWADAQRNMTLFRDQRVHIYKAFA